MTHLRLTGIIPATYTPFDSQGDLNLAQVTPLAERLIHQGVSGFYVCGSTGEGISMTTEERKRVAEAFVQAASGRVPAIIQVGHNSLQDSRDLAAHAQQIGATAISANAPSYYKVTDVAALVACTARVASAAPDLPFYYYHIPSMTGAQIDMVDFLAAAGETIPNLVGLKYTAATAHEFQRCLEFEEGRFDVLWGTDEMLLSGLATGARGAVGSTYNYAAPLYLKIIAAVEQGDLPRARQLQSKILDMIAAMARYPFHSAAKQVLTMLGNDVGPCRLPIPSMDPNDVPKLRKELDSISFFDWSQ